MLVPATDGVVSYSMPQGDKRGATWEMFDATYDGHWDGELQRGLGQLTDGRVGPDNFKMGYYNYERGKSSATFYSLEYVSFRRQVAFKTSFRIK